MPRAILPFIFVILGITVAGLATNMPLFEWDISETSTGLPLNVQHHHSLLTTKLGDSLSTRFYTKGGFSLMNPLCFSSDLGITFARSERDLAIEQTALAIEKTVTPWMFDAGLRVLIPLACIIYIWVFAIFYKRSIGESIAFSAIAVVVFCLIIDLWKVLIYKVGSTFGSSCAGLLSSYPATVYAALSKTHYETWIVFSMGVLLELGAFAEILFQIARALFKDKIPLETTVG